MQQHTCYSFTFTTMHNMYVLFQAVYAAIKYFVGLNKIKPVGVVRYSLILLTILIFVLVVLILIPLNFATILADFCLHIWYGKQYGGILKGMDFMMEATEKPMGINMFFIIKRNGSYEEYEQSMRRSFERVHNSCCKLSYELGTTLGHKYYLKSNVKFEDVVKIVDVSSLSRDNIEEYVDENFMDVNALLGNKTWRVFIFKQPIKWSDRNERPEHVIIVSFRHSIGDGIPLGCLLVDNLGGIELLVTSEKLKRDFNERRKFALDELYVYDTVLMQKPTFQRTNLQNYIVFYVERDVRYVPLIKALKSKLNVGFGDVLIGCLVAALAAHAEKHRQHVNKLKLFSTLRPINKETLDMLEGRFDYNNISNKVIGYTMNTPSDISHKTLTETIQGCYHEGQKMKKAVDFIIAFALTKIGHTLSAPVAKYLIQRTSGALDLAVSNGIGMKSGAINGHTIEATIPFLTESLNMGFFFGVWSLRGKLQLCLIGAKSVLKTRGDLDNILADMLKNVDSLYAEVSCKESNNL